MAGSDRAINMALRVLGIGEVERDFKRVGSAGEAGFGKVEKSANGASKEVSEYTARLKRAAAEANHLADKIPQLNRPGSARPAGLNGARGLRPNQDRLDFVQGAVKAEQARMLQGLPDTIGDLAAGKLAADGFGMSLTRMAAFGAAAGGALVLVGAGVKASLGALMEHERALDNFETSLALAGNRSNATGTEIAAMADKIVRSTIQTEQAALKAAQQLATIPGITKQGLQAALEASAALADGLGVDLPEVIEKYTRPALTALADKDMKALWKATEGLSDVLRVTVRDLAEAGRTADAQRVLLDGLRAAAGDGPDGLTSATDQLGKSWKRLEVGLGADIAGPATLGLNLLADSLDWLRGKAVSFGISWNQIFSDAASVFSPMAGLLIRAQPKSAAAKAGDSFEGGDAFGIGAMFAQAARVRAQGYDRQDGSSPKRARARGGRKAGGSGKSDAQRELERLAKEAEAARAAADKIEESNQDVIASYALRGTEAKARLGLEGEALAAVERAQEVDAAARRISADLIDKEVAAQRALAASKKLPFDEAAATMAATTAYGAQVLEVRRLAGEYVEVNRQLAEFAQRQSEAAAVLEQVKTPFEQIREEVGRLNKMFAEGDISAETFNRRMDQLAGDLVDAADKAGNAWQGFGDEFASAITDVLMNGGSAIDVLQELVRIPLERLWQTNFTDPLANWIDGLTGNNRDKNVADARSGLPTAADGAAISVGTLGSAAQGAAAALMTIPGNLGAPIDGLTAQTDAAGQALGALVPLTGQFGGVLGQVIAQLSAGGGGGGDIFGSILKLGVAAFGGGGPSAGLVADVASTQLANPGLFASGSPGLPMGRDIMVGENGRERMRYLGGDRMQLIGSARTHRMAQDSGGGGNIYQTINVPPRTDPRRTASSIARTTQGAIARSARKGLAVGPRA